MGRKTAKAAGDDSADDLLAGNVDGWLANLLVEEEPYNRRMLWQLGSWAGAALGSLVLAFLAAQSTNAMRTDLAAANDLVRQTQQIANAVSERDGEARRLLAAVDTLNADRDRLYARVTGLEQNLDSVTSSIRPRSFTGPLEPLAWPSPPPLASAPDSVPVQIQPSAAAKDKKDAAEKSAPFAAAPLAAPAPKPEPDDSKRAAAQDPAPVASAPVGADSAPQPKAIVVTALPPLETTGAIPEIPVAKTEFGVDLGTANSIEGLRGLWRAVQTSNKQLVSSLRPVVAFKERSGLGMQLRLIAGPLTDAAAAARICAVLNETDRPCETAFFDGQRLSPGPETPVAKPAPAPAPRKRVRASRRAPAPAPAPAARPARSSFSSFIGAN